MTVQLELFNQDCLEALRGMAADSVDSVVTDPPYFLTNGSGTGFMGKAWDSLSPSNAIVEAFFKSLRLDLSTVGASIAVKTANTTQEKSHCQPIHAELAETPSKDIGRLTNTATSSVRQNALTKAEVVALSRELAPSLTKLLEKLPDSASFVASGLFTEATVRNYARSVADILSDEPKWLEQIITFTNTADQRKSVIAVQTGLGSDDKYTNEMTSNAESVENTAEEKTFSAITSPLTPYQATTQKVTSLPCVRHVTRQCIKIPSFIPILSESFHFKWAKEALRVLKPGGYVLSFGGTRTAHRMASSLEDAGFEYRDTICWLHGQGFPKSLNVEKALNEMGLENASDFTGLGTALKPAFEPVIMCRKPLGEKTVAANVLKHGTGALNIDGCRIGSDVITTQGYRNGENGSWSKQGMYADDAKYTPKEHVGRFPANLVFSHSEGCKQVGTKKVKGTAPPGAPSRGKAEDAGASWSKGATTPNLIKYADADGTETVEAWECASDCAVRALDAQSGPNCGAAAPVRKKATPATTNVENIKPHASVGDDGKSFRGDSGGASRFFKTFAGESRFLYCAKASKKDKGANNSHPTVKSTALMQYLIKLVTPPGGTVLDPFMGSGSTGVAALGLGYGFYGIEKEPEYFEIACGRIAEALEKIPGDHPPEETTTEEESQDSTEELALAENQ